jgi:hypothetical protein
MQGEDYQARFFWLQACRLFEPHSRVSRVGYELEDVKAFDDVATFYSTPIPDERGGLVQADYYQVKFHVDHSGAFTWQAMMDPRFIGASSVSLLQRLRLAQRKFAPNGKGCRFHIVAPWPVHPDDEMASLVSNQGGEIRLHVLFDGTSERSSMGKARTAWRQHLGLTEDTELFSVLYPLRIQPSAYNLESLRDRLNDKLRLAGLRPIDAQSQACLYDDLIRKVRATGQKEFTRNQIREICEREGLWCGNPVLSEEAVQVGVRSFMRWAEYMEDETDYMLCLVRYFDNRMIQNPPLWKERIFPELTGFLSDTMRQPCQYHLHLDAHASIAFAAGYCLDSKSGVDVVPVQRTSSGKIPWRPTRAEQGGDLSSWSCTDVERASDGNDVALAISVTHDILSDVQLYVNRELPTVRRIVSLTVCPRPCSTAVQDGTHALLLAQDIATIVKKRSVRERIGTLHIFAAAPNAMAFFLGQLAHGFGPCVLYEYDFESNAPGAYRPSLTFPPQRSASGLGNGG